MCRVVQLKYALGIRTGMKAQRGSIRKRTGGRLREHRDRRKHELGREPTETQVAETRLKVVDARGGAQKVRALATDQILVNDGGDTTETTIENVVENPANPNYVRRNIVTKGAVVETPDGRARITSRPGQAGHVCGVLEQ